MLEPMEIEAVPCLADNYAYLLVDPTGHAIVVDPSEAEPVRDAIERRSLSLVGIWATHHHHDHVGGIAELVARYPGVEVVGSAYDAQHKRIPKLTRALTNDDPLWFESRRVRLLFVPGHTLGAVAYVCDDAVFSGDTLFSAGCGRMFEGTPSVMQSSMASLRSLPPETKLYCGHEYTAANLRFAAFVEPDNAAVQERAEQVRELRAQGRPSIPSTMAQECEVNPFLRWDQPPVIEKAMSLGARSTEPAEVFGALRAAKDTF